MVTPRVSFVLPTHNRADVLGFAIASVLAQSMEDFELLIVGDGCTDSTEVVVRSFRDPRVRWMPFAKGPNLGYCHRNVAFKESRGEFIAFMAHDDLILHDHLEILLPHFEDEPIEIVHSRPLWIDPRGRLTPSTFSLRNCAQRAQFVRREINAIPASCFLHRRRAFDQVGYWNDNLTSCGDWDFYARVIAHGGDECVAVESRATCLHFRANWRTGKFVAPAEIDAWEAWPVQRGEFLLALEGERDTEPEQERFWKAMSVSPKQWADALRAETARLIDARIGLADAARLESQRRIDELEAECAPKQSWILELEAQCSAKDRWSEKLQRDIDELNAALRLTAPRDHRA